MATRTWRRAPRAPSSAQASVFREWVAHGRAGALPPLRRGGLPVVPPHDDRARADGARARRSGSPTSTRSATSAAGRSPAGASSIRSRGWSSSPRPTCAPTRELRRARHRAGAVGPRGRADRQQRVERDHPHVRARRLRRRRRRSSTRRRSRPRSTRSTSASTRRVNNGVYRCGFARTQAAYEAALRPLFETLDWLEELLGERRYLLGDAADRGRLAAVPDARALRRRLLRPLQVQPAPARRLPEPVGLHARALPAARDRGDRRARRDQAPLLRHAPVDQPDADRARSGRRSTSTRRTGAAERGAQASLETRQMLIPPSTAWRSISASSSSLKLEVRERGDVLLELRDAARADQRRADARVAQDPGDRQLGERSGRGAAAISLQRADAREVLLGEHRLAESARRARTRESSGMPSR